MQIKDYIGNIIKVENKCPACAYANHKFSLPCGMAYEDEICTVSQDWELPINGMIIVAPKRHVELFEELTQEERAHLTEITNKAITIMRKHNISKLFNVLFEEKKDVHFHIWIIPRDGWKEIGIDPTKDIRSMQQHALTNLRTTENFDKIIETTSNLHEELKNL